MAEVWNTFAFKTFNLVFLPGTDGLRLLKRIVTRLKKTPKDKIFMAAIL